MEGQPAKRTEEGERRGSSKMITKAVLLVGGANNPTRAGGKEAGGSL